MSQNILFRVGGGHLYSVGLGHVYRCIRLARLFSEQGVSCSFLMKNYETGVTLVQTQCFDVVTIDQDVSFAQEVSCLIDHAREKQAVVFFDLRSSKQALVISCREAGLKTVVYEDDCQEQTTPDLLFNPSPLQTEAYQSDTKVTEHRLGLEYLVLDPDLVRYRRPLFKRKISNLFLCFGGADASHATVRVLKMVLEGLFEGPVTLALGPAFADRLEIDRMLAEKDAERRVTLVAGNDHLSELHARHDAAVTAGGTLACESMTLCVPTLVVPTIRHEAEIARYLEGRRLVMAVPEDHTRLSDEVLKKHISAFIADDAGRELLFNHCCHFKLDGGAGRVVAAVRSIFHFDN